MNPRRHIRYIAGVPDGLAGVLAAAPGLPRWLTGRRGPA